MINNKKKWEQFYTFVYVVDLSQVSLLQNNSLWASLYILWLTDTSKKQKTICSKQWISLHSTD